MKKDTEETAETEETDGVALTWTEIHSAEGKTRTDWAHDAEYVYLRVKKVRADEDLTFTESDDGSILHLRPGANAVLPVDAPAGYRYGVNLLIRLTRSVPSKAKKAAVTRRLG